MSLKEAGVVGWIPFLAGNLGALTCAAISDRLVLRYKNPARARLALLIGISCFGPLACLVPHASSMPLVLGLLSVVAIVCIGWFAVLGPLVTDLFPVGNSASVWAIAGAFGAVGAMISNYAIGRVSSALGTEKMFLVLGLLHLAALAVLLFFVKTDRYVRDSAQET